VCCAQCRRRVQAFAVVVQDGGTVPSTDWLWSWAEARRQSAFGGCACSSLARWRQKQRWIARCNWLRSQVVTVVQVTFSTMFILVVTLLYAWTLLVKGNMKNKASISTFPSYLHPCFTRVADMTSRQWLWSSTSHRLDVPPVRSTVGKRAFPVFWCHCLERPACPRRICAITRALQTTTRPFPFIYWNYDLIRWQLPFASRCDKSKVLNWSVDCSSLNVVQS